MAMVQVYLNGEFGGACGWHSMLNIAPDGSDKLRLFHPIELTAVDAKLATVADRDAIMLRSGKKWSAPRAFKTYETRPKKLAEIICRQADMRTRNDLQFNRAETERALKMLGAAKAKVSEAVKPANPPAPCIFAEQAKREIAMVAEKSATVDKEIDRLGVQGFVRKKTAEIVTEPVAVAKVDPGKPFSGQLVMSVLRKAKFQVAHRNADNSLTVGWIVQAPKSTPGQVTIECWQEKGASLETGYTWIGRYADLMREAGFQVSDPTVYWQKTAKQEVAAIHVSMASA